MGCAGDWRAFQLLYGCSNLASIIAINGGWHGIEAEELSEGIHDLMSLTTLRRVRDDIASREVENDQSYSIVIFGHMLWILLAYNFVVCSEELSEGSWLNPCVRHILSITATSTMVD